MTCRNVVCHPRRKQALGQAAPASRATATMTRMSSVSRAGQPGRPCCPMPRDRGRRPEGGPPRCACCWAAEPPSSPVAGYFLIRPGQAGFHFRRRYAGREPLRADNRAWVPRRGVNLPPDGAGSLNAEMPQKAVLRHIRGRAAARRRSRPGPPAASRIVLPQRIRLEMRVGDCDQHKSNTSSGAGEDQLKSDVRGRA